MTTAIRGAVRWQQRRGQRRAGSGSRGEEEVGSAEKGQGPVLGDKWVQSGGAGPGLGVGSGAVPRGWPAGGGVIPASDTDEEGTGACVISQDGSISR